VDAECHARNRQNSADLLEVRRTELTAIVSGHFQENTCNAPRHVAGDPVKVIA
jgi:hypothetical protein